MQIFRRKPEAPHSASPLAGFSFAGDAVLSILHWVAGSQPALTTMPRSRRIAFRYPVPRQHRPVWQPGCRIDRIAANSPAAHNGAEMPPRVEMSEDRTRGLPNSPAQAKGKILSGFANPLQFYFLAFSSLRLLGGTCLFSPFVSFLLRFLFRPPRQPPQQRRRRQRCQGPSESANRGFHP